MVMIETDKLMRMSSYARSRNVSVPCVLNWVRSEKVKTISIDGTVFIVDGAGGNVIDMDVKEENPKPQQKNTSAVKLDYDIVYKTWNDMLCELPSYRQGVLSKAKRTPKRDVKIRTLLSNNKSTLDELLRLIRTIPYADGWVFGETDRKWNIDLGWMLDDVKGWYMKALEGGMHKTDNKRFKEDMSHLPVVENTPTADDNVSNNADVIDGIKYE